MITVLSVLRQYFRSISFLLHGLLYGSNFKVSLLLWKLQENYNFFKFFNVYLGELGQRNRKNSFTRGIAQFSYMQITGRGISGQSLKAISTHLRSSPKQWRLSQAGRVANISTCSYKTSHYNKIIPLKQEKIISIAVYEGYFTKSESRFEGLGNYFLREFLLFKPVDART